MNSSKPRQQLFGVLFHRWRLTGGILIERCSWLGPSGKGNLEALTTHTERPLCLIVFQRTTELESQHVGSE